MYVDVEQSIIIFFCGIYFYFYGEIRLIMKNAILIIICRKEIVILGKLLPPEQIA